MLLLVRWRYECASALNPSVGWMRINSLRKVSKGSFGTGIKRFVSDAVAMLSPKINHQSSLTSSLITVTTPKAQKEVCVTVEKHYLECKLYVYSVQVLYEYSDSCITYQDLCWHRHSSGCLTQWCSVCGGFCRTGSNRPDSWWRTR